MQHLPGRAQVARRPRHLPHGEKPIRETPPTTGELKAALELLGGDIRKLFNTSGMDYRALGLKDKLPGHDRSATPSPCSRKTATS